MPKNPSVDAVKQSEPIFEDAPKVVSLETEKILEQLRRNEDLSRNILKSLRFIRHYYAWRSLLSVIKYSLLVAVIVLGLISWRGIVEYINQSVSGNNSALTNLILK